MIMLNIERSFHMNRDRYYYDFGQCKTWKQYDTDEDAWYFGVWVNPDTFQILTFAEGDETLTTCSDEASYHAELSRMSDFYDNPPPAFKVIDADGTLTKYFDTRPI